MFSVLRKMETILPVAMAVAVAHLVLGFILWFRIRKLYSYPGCWGFPILGNLYYFYKTMFIFKSDSLLSNMAQVAEKFGKNGICFHFIYGFEILVIVSSPQVIKQLRYHPNLKDKPDYPYKGFETYMIGPFSRAKSDDQWKIMRKEYNSCLTKSKIENDYFGIFLKSADELVELMLASPSALDIHTAVLGVNQSVTMKTLFGFESSLAYHPEVIRHMLNLKNIASLFIASPKISRTVTTILRLFDEVCLRKIGQLRSKILVEIDKNMNNSYQCHSLEKSTGSSLSLSMRIASRNKGRKYFNLRVVNELQESFISSSHSISSTMASMLTFFSMFPKIQERAWKEQNEIFGDDTREPTLNDLQQMKYLERFIKESFRFCGPPMIGKETSQDIEVDGIIIPKGVTVCCIFNYMRKDPKYWKDPEEFDPDRFLEETEEMKLSLSPFGMGVRSCPGMNFAMTQMKIIYSKVLRRTKLSLVNKDIKFKDLVFEAVVLMELKNPPLLQVEKRN